MRSLAHAHQNSGPCPHGPWCFMLQLKEFYSAASGRELLLYAAVLAASLFFMIAGLLRAFAYGNAVALSIACLGCASAGAAVASRNRNRAFVLPRRLLVAACAVLAVSVIVLALIP